MPRPNRIQENATADGKIVVTAFYPQTAKCRKTGMTIGVRKQFSGQKARELLSEFRQSSSTANGYGIY